MAALAQATGALLFLAMCALSRGAGVIHLTDMYGTIQTPNFPESYPKESDMQWNISVPEGFQIRLYFMHFDVEPSYLCEYDYVKVLSDQDELAVFCGKESTDTEQVPGDDIITSIGSALSLVFRSDFSNEERFSGFEAHYSAVDVDECSDRNDEDLACDHLCHNYIGGYYCSCRYGYLLHSDNRTCKVECSDGVYTERTGVISSSDFPQPYPKSSDCLYRIQLEDGFLIALDFHDTFDIEDHPEVTCPYDYLKIQAGQRTLGPFCGDRSPGRIQTGSSSVTILFHSDNSGENLGWKLTYSATGSECPVPVMPPNGHLEPLQPKYSFKDHVLVTCDAGYVLFKDGEVMEHHQIDCLKDGTWSSEVPPCTLINCGPPEEIVKGEVLFDGPDNSTLFGASFQYRCLEDSQSSTPSPSDAIPTPPHAIPTAPAATPTPPNARPTPPGAIPTPVDATPTPPNSILTPPTTPPADNSTYITRTVSNGTYVCGERGKWTNAELGTKLPSCLPACGEPSQPLPSHVRRIVGGRVALAGQFPWQARLSVEDSSRVPEGRWFGSGALLSASWVLTAAHVLRSPRRDPSVVPVSPGSVRVHLGLADLRRPPVASAGLAVQRLLLHPRFDPRNYNHDIALIRLAQPALYTPLVRPVCLPLPWAEGQPPAPPPNTLGLVAGWGVMATNGSADSAALGAVAADVDGEGEGGVSDVLRYVKLPVVERSECEGSYASRSRSYNITGGMFCAGFYEGGRDTCQGDSGGAFVTQDPRTGRWVVQGLVSWGGPEECGSRRVYGVYTRVGKYAHWLHSHMDTDRWW